jgi:hypothetical protein
MKEAGVSPPLFWELARDTQAIFSNWAIQHRMLKKHWHSPAIHGMKLT